MGRTIWRSSLVLAFCVGLASVVSCTLLSTPTRQPNAPPPPGIQATRIDYVDTDGFDAVLEVALTNNDPVIIIQTHNSKPDWEGRLNAWIAAWNRGGKVEASERRKVRMQAPLLPPINVDKDSVREFRTLVENFMDRVDRLAQNGAVWWAEERTQRRRIELLKPYNLRFHQDEDQFIQIIFFNGNYAPQYTEFMRSVVLRGFEGDDLPWQRDFRCSRCKEPRVVKTEP